MLIQAGEAMKAYTGHYRSARASFDQYEDIRTNISVRNEFRRSDYDYFRPSEAIPIEPKEIMSQCNLAYRKVGLVRNIIDLMGDFGAQGITISHPNRRIEQFYKGWFKWVNGPERSERFLNLFYRLGNIVVKRNMTKVGIKSRETLKAIASMDADEIDKTPPILPDSKKNIVPYRYDFLSPMGIKIAGGELAQFVGKQIYSICISTRLALKIKSPKTDEERVLASMLPQKIINAIRNGKRTIPLDPEVIEVFHYKKDDWQAWADPMTYAVLDQVKILDKMQLADLAALDGAISQIRLWTLGDLEQGIFPTDEGINKLSEILLSNPGGGAFDIIWGPELSVKALDSNVHEFLGNDKYVPILNGIYAGLGVPPTLTGAATASGLTNNFISLKTLIQRLEYGRAALIKFWEKEIAIVQRALGFRLPAKIRFDRMILSDEAAEKALLLQMADRNLVSIDTILERFGEIPELERLRLKREEKERKTGGILPKAGPWHKPEKEFELAKIALMKGYISPVDSGIDIEDDYDEDNPFLLQLEVQKKAKEASNNPTPTTKSNKGTNGRPTGSKDSPGTSRNRTPNPMSTSSANLAEFFTQMSWAKSAQIEILEKVQKPMLASFGKKNMRSVSVGEAHTIEDLKLAILLNTKPFSTVSDQSIHDILSNNPNISSEAKILCKRLNSDIIDKRGREANLEETRLIHSIVYSILNKAFI